MAGEVAQRQRDDEHLLVVAHVAVVGVPRREADVETRVLVHQIRVNQPDAVQLTVWRRQQRVQDVEA